MDLGSFGEDVEDFQGAEDVEGFEAGEEEHGVVHVDGRVSITFRVLSKGSERLDLWVCIDDALVCLRSLGLLVFVRR